MLIYISDYNSQVKAKNWDFPDYSECCPICGGKKCAVRIGFYYRQVFDIFLMIYITDVPIARYICRRKNRPIITDLTFSLLPNCCIPYYAATIDTFMEIIGIIQDNNSYSQILDLCYSKIYDNNFNISIAAIKNYSSIFHQTVVKMRMFFIKNKTRPPPDANGFSKKYIYQYITDFKSINNNSSSVSCSDNYYEREGAYQKNANFLIGTAYQFR